MNSLAHKLHKALAKEFPLDKHYIRVELSTASGTGIAPYTTLGAYVSERGQLHYHLQDFKVNNYKEALALIPFMVSEIKESYHAKYNLAIPEASV